jgi:hypothetical protein
MPSLLLVVFVLQFLLHIINTVGASTVNELVRLSACTTADMLTPPAMGPLQQAPNTHLGISTPLPGAQEGDCAA